MKKFIYYFIYIIVMFGGMEIHQVFSAGLVLENSLTPTNLDQTARVDVFMDTGGEVVNTISGVITTDRLSTVNQLIIGNSLVSLWIDTPTINETKQQINFSGIIPGGITTRHGYLFSIIMSSSTGSGTLTSSDLHMLKHDGLGTEVVANNTSVTLTTTNNISSLVVDRIPPEQFFLIRTHNHDLFDDHNVIIFNTQDKGTGVSAYRICEWFIYCDYSNSPYVLKNQSSWYVISVRAFDYENNTTVAYLFSTYAIVSIAIIVISSILGLIYVFSIRKK